MPSPEAAKAEWRRWARTRRATVDFVAVGEAIRANLVASGFLHGTVLTYLAMGDEVDLSPLVGVPGVRWAITRTPVTGPVTVHLLGGEMERHPFGFEQPSAAAPQLDPLALDVLLLPGLAFDRHGGRLGRGKGYIDGLLSRVRRDAVTIGIGPEAVIVERLPMEGHDRPLSHLASERGIFAFRAQQQ